MVVTANLSNYGSDVILKVPYHEPYHTDMDNQSVHTMQGFEQTLVVDFTDNEITSDSNIISYSQYLQEMQQAAVQDTNLYAQQDSMILSVIEQMSEQMIKSVISSQHVACLVIDDEETLILEELNQLSEDFGKHFVPQQELSDKQAFWLQTSHHNINQSASSLVKIQDPKELPKERITKKKTKNKAKTTKPDSEWKRL
ncbi:hypothetical protein Tco_0687386 [Tanacetum coccineum]